MALFHIKIDNEVKYLKYKNLCKVGARGSALGQGGKWPVAMRGNFSRFPLIERGLVFLQRKHCWLIMMMMLALFFWL